MNLKVCCLFNRSDPENYIDWFKLTHKIKGNKWDYKYKKVLNLVQLFVFVEINIKSLKE